VWLYCAVGYVVFCVCCVVLFGWLGVVVLFAVGCLFIGLLLGGALLVFGYFC